MNGSESHLHFGNDLVAGQFEFQLFFVDACSAVSAVETTTDKKFEHRYFSSGPGVEVGLI
jgi:hypothetical protein